MSNEKISTTKKLATVAIFAALCYGVSFLEFSIFPAASFLKLDFSNVFTMLIGFMYGPISALATSVIKELLCFLTKSQTSGIGEMANVMMTAAYVLLPSIVYRYKKGFKLVVALLLIACLLQTGAGLLTNRFILFPLYMGDGATEAFNSLYPYIIYFNLIKSVSISIITILLYKRVYRLIQRI